ncbi:MULTISPECIES: ABC transporter ATP-binding protein/permease [Bradyrhizobium]|jgi:putative ATP-binding cassette transporter|uniref:ABC transporter ATP-binding protein/permease n=2 Tax=Bradyrhizobium TaxID=374 RepID=A0ABS5G0F7_9BRAD|nr:MULTISPECIES: ABC transporter ATP-binding protein/permease [Bradyrhizobium]MBR1134793.1 ABC transporter ATP-binding protein/permease [Bradyrhizobium denitrificans]MDU1497698.1 ABC transporter ATP-binding protein/permease [Bradyrhizobium sp.]MDU1542268.1 ABC transporter ATP-binding protein/permease [Bradyrhizobium sp.]MDU1807520.1 ABC transporter ATP-binding protein/permease [Bradyrhizobium sp.]MDU3098433.1 ABC transporter ATP-binding protein/permease [Bradyrhizobium sp.]
MGQVQDIARPAVSSADEAPIIEIAAENGAQVEPPPPEVVEPDPELSPEEAEQVRKRYLLTRFWISARGYWGAAGDRLAWPFTIGLLILIVGTVAFQYGINVWNRSIFDAIEKRDSATVFHLTAIFFPLAIGSVILAVSQVYARMAIQRRWRAWLTNSIITRWLASGRYYQLNLVSGDHKNPEYRIAEDLRIATDSPVDFVAGVTSALLSAATFIVVLWTIGGALTLRLGGTELTIPGFLVLAAVIYAAIASGSIVTIGRRFVQTSEDKNQAEADFRYALTRVRENGESIALLGGEAEERAGIDRTFGNVLGQWARLAGQHMRTTLVSQGSSLIAPVVPLLLCAPKFLDGSMTLGQVMQAASAFTIVQTAFGWLVDNYPRLADWNACARRIASLMMSLDALERAERGDGLGRIKHGETTGDAMLSLNDLSVTLDDGTAVVGETEVVVDPGERLLVAGESGTGKSTLVRAIAGLWPWGGGSINFHPDRRLFMLPQRPYVPSGSLRRAVAYPGAAEDWPVEQVADALHKVGLDHLKDRIEEEAPWDQTLSGGEKQRLAFARLLLHSPDIVVLDEATSALDEKSQDRMMQVVTSELPKATIVSVAHRAELEAFHSRKIVLERRKGGAKLVSDIDLIPRKGKRRLIGRFLRQRKQL